LFILKTNTMQKILLFLLLFVSITLEAQPPNNLYGIVRKNYFSIVTDPRDSLSSYERFDSATIRLGTTNPSEGIVYNFGSNSYNMPVNLTGAALNPYTNSFIFIGNNTINTLNLATGNLTNSVPLNNPIAPSYFDNFRFNNADSTIYGLARRNLYDPVTMSYIGQVFLAKANTQTGLITQISPTSVGLGFALAGSAIDPYQMVYYYSTGARLVGLDIYDGSIFSSVPIQVTNGINFDNFTYSCADTALYGLIRQNYFSYEKNPIDPLDSIQVLDSTSIKLGRIDPKTGIVTTISPGSLMQGGYTLNGGSAIDPNAMTYYFNRGNAIAGVSLITGELVSNKVLSFEDGQYFDLMRNFENCISASAFRGRKGSTGIARNLKEATIEIFPNPNQGMFSIQSSFSIKHVSILSIAGEQIFQQGFGSNQIDIDMSSFNEGVYIINLSEENGQTISRKLVKY